MAAEQPPEPETAREPTRAIMVRVPRSLHVRLRAAGAIATPDGLKPSMNRFCVRALAAAADAALAMDGRLG